MMLKKISAKRLYFVALFVAIMHSQIYILMSVVSGKSIDAIIADPRKFFPGVLVISLIYLLVIIFSTANEWFRARFEIEESRHMRDRSFAAFLCKKHASSEECEKLRGLIDVNIPSIVERVFSGTSHIIITSTSVLMCSFSLLAMNPLWALIIIAASVAMVLLPRAMNKRGQDATNAYTETVGRFNLQLQSFLGGHSLIHAFNYRYGAIRQMEAMDEERMSAQLKRHRYLTAVYGISASLNMIQNAAILLIGLAFILKGALTVGELVAAIQLASSICGTMEALSYYIYQRSETLPMLDSYEALLQEEEETRLETGRRLPVNIPLTLTLRNVGFDVGGVAILKNACIALRPGGKYLLIGPSGSGKSTAMRILAGIASPSSGEAIANGKRIADYDDQDYARHVCMMPQHSYLFYATLRENILMGREMPEAEYESLLRKTNLWSLSERLRHSPLDQRQLENLSGGEKQRICLARTMAGNPHVYLMDEITASLDPVNTDMIMNILFQLDATILFVCHQPRKEWASHWDAVYEIQDGVITEAENFH